MRLGIDEGATFIALLCCTRLHSMVRACVVIGFALLAVGAIADVDLLAHVSTVALLKMTFNFKRSGHSFLIWISHT